MNNERLAIKGKENKNKDDKEENLISEGTSLNHQRVFVKEQKSRRGMC